MLRDNLVGLIEPMFDSAGAHAGGCSRSTELAIVALRRSWRQIFLWKMGDRQKKENGRFCSEPLRLMTLALSAPNSTKVIGR
jgi:hypothetical protein